MSLNDLSSTEARASLSSMKEAREGLLEKSKIKIPFWRNIAVSFSIAISIPLGFYLFLGLGGAGPSSTPKSNTGKRVVINTWWPGPANASYAMLSENYSALDSVIAGCVSAEESFAFGDHTVGPNGSPDSNGESTLDALLGDGATGDFGAVAYLRRIPSAIRAAHAVMTYTRHSLMSGDGASALVSSLGGQEQKNLSGSFSNSEYWNWLNASCQPNYYAPDWALGSNTSCGPYTPRPIPSPTPLPLDLHGSPALLATRRRESAPKHRFEGWATPSNHDTLGLCALDASGSLAVGVTSNGANHKTAGRVGDAPVIGAGGYASDDSGGCAAATGECVFSF